MLRNPVLFAVPGLVSTAAATDGVSFLTLGDWGGAALGEQDKLNVYSVSAQMTRTAHQKNVEFIINTGDNFYWCGIQNTSDYQIDVDFVRPYHEPKLQVPWYTALGNHEYGYNVEAQLEYSLLNEIWVLPDRYYSKRVALDTQADAYMTLIVIDSSPCVSDYRSEDSAYWDPCGSEYPTCSLDTTDDDFEGPCQFHENIMSQDCQSQYDWLQSTLNDVNPTDWLVIVGHHPADEIDVLDFTSLIQKHGFDLYLNGHAHTLTQYSIDNTGAYITSGAGSLVDTNDQVRERTRRKVKGDNEITTEVEPTSGHSYQTIFNDAVAGFTLHTFDSTYETLCTEFLSYTGEVLHSFSVTKGQGFDPDGEKKRKL